MNIDIPYMPSVKNVNAIMAKIQGASLPASFTIDFLRDLGFPSSNDRSLIKFLKYIGFIDNNSKPLEPYKKYLDHNNSKKVLGQQLKIAFDDLFIAHKNANKMSGSELKGWFRTKTGQSDAVAEKIASTFKAFADLSEFADHTGEKATDKNDELSKDKGEIPISLPLENNKLGLVYRFEIHLPDTQNIDTYRAIFKAIKEELLK